MSYEKQTWVNDDVISAEKLNHIENGIAGINGSNYEPTVWTTGDIITAEKLNKIEQALYELSNNDDDEPPEGYTTIVPKQSVTITGSEEGLVPLTKADGYVIAYPIATDLLVKVNGTVVPYDSEEDNYTYSDDSITYLVTLFNPQRILNPKEFGFIALDAMEDPVAGTYEVVIYEPAQ